MKKTSKKLLSLMLAVLMIATMIPSFAVVAEATTPQTSTQWTEIASTDFTKSTSWSGTRSGLSDFYSQTANTFKSNNNSESDNVWWSGWVCKRDDITVFQNDATLGCKVVDGFLYMTGWNKNGSSQSNTPITGKSTFKIDVEFAFYGDYSLDSDWKKNTFIKLKTDNYSSESYPWQNNWFAQCGYGSMYNSGDSENSPTISRSSSTSAIKENYFKLASDNALIGKNNLCHYIFEYSHGTIRTYVTDGSGNVLINFGSVDSSADSSAIKGIQLGACTGSHKYYQYTAYKNVTFYEGTEATYSPEKENSNDKYLYAYFTGNSDAGEKLRYAVSSDGYNWESLNGANAVADAHAIAGSLTVYPAGGRTGLAATGNVRDPYILYAQDGTYYVLATDLDTDTYGFDNNCKLLVWHVNSLVDIDTATPWVIDCTSLLEDAMGSDCVLKRAWAPEAVYDYEEGKYMLFFAAKDSNNTYGTRMYYIYTSDFQTFDGKAKLLLPHVYADNIDANITYADGMYYMWYKDETDSKIGYATAEHANGPYGTIHKFYEDRLSSVFEGPEVYYNAQAGKYILIADNFGGGSYMAAYQSDTVSGFSASNKLLDGTAYNMTHMYPRHGFITRISTSDYNALIAKYGRDVCFNSNVPSGHKAKEYLIARYFTNSDATADVSGHNNNLDSSNAVMGTYHDRYAADFSGNKVAYKSIASMLSTEGVNAKDGITFDWYGYSTADAHGRFFDMCSVDRGTVVWDGSGNNQKNSNYIYCSEGIEFGAYYGNGSGRSGASKSYTDTDNEWHRYTMVLSNGWIEFYVDGELYGWTVGFNNGSGAVIGANTPASCGDGFNDTVLSSMTNLLFGDSAWRDDEDFLGAISDFRIFNRALTFEDVESSDSVVSTGSYLSDEASFNKMIAEGLITKTGDVSWNSNENAAYFNGGYLTVNENPLESTTGTTGFTISFDFKRTTGSENNSRVIDINDGTTTNTFAINGGAYSGSEWNRLRTFAKVGGTECNYYANDFGNTNYCTYFTSGICYDGDTNDTWHNFTAVMDASGYYSCYYDGVLRATFKNNYETTGNSLGNGVTASQIKTQMAAMTQVNIGKAIYNDPTFRGYIKNVKFVAQDVDTQISTLAGFEDALAVFETKMKLGAHSGSENAYKAYISAKEKYDSNIYGKDGANYDGARNTLITAINAMSKMSPTFNAPNYSHWYHSSGNANAESQSYYCPTTVYKNVLYASDVKGAVYSTSRISYSSKERAALKYYYPSNLVWMYDGVNKNYAPIAASAQWKNGAGYVKTIFPATSSGGDNSQLCLTDYWGYRTTGNGDYVDYYWNFAAPWTYAGYSSSTGYKDGYSPNDSIGSTWRGFTNILSYNGGDFNANGTSINDFYIYALVADNGSGGEHSTNNKMTDGQIKIVNYKYYYQNICKELNYNYSDYLVGYDNMVTLLNNADTAQAINFWDYFSASNYYSSSENYTGCKSAMDTKLGNVTGATNPSTDSRIKAYATLKGTIDSERTIGGITYSVLDAYQEGTDTVGFTTTTYSNFKTAYENAKNMFAALDTNDSQSGYEQNTLETINALNTALSSAFANLELKADFRALDAAKAAWITFANSSDVTSAYTTSSVQALKDYVNSTTEFPLENAADRNDTGVSQNSAIAAEIAKYTALDSVTILDKLADLTYFDAEFDKANTFLLNLNGKTAEYTADSVQNLVNKATAAAISGEGHANKDVQTIANANAEARADFGQAVQTDAAKYADDIKAAMAGLEKIDKSVDEDVSATDLSAYEAAVAELNNIDPDMYQVTKGDIDSIRRSANASFEDHATEISYRTATINAIDGEVTQEEINGATTEITTALTVRTKQYTITKDNSAGSSTDFTVSSREGTSYASGETANYGTTIVASTNDASEAAWYLEIWTDSMHKTSAFQGYGKRLSTKVLGNTKIKAIKRGAGESKVTIIRQYDDAAVTERSPLQTVEYVATNGSYTLPSAPAIAFYTFDGYYTTSGSKLGASVTISEDTELYARYVAAAGASCAINVLSDETQNRTVAYNTRVSLTGSADTYAWVEAIDETHFRPFYIGKDVEFLASESAKLKAVDKTTFDNGNYTLPAVNLRQNGIIEIDGKKVFNAQLVNDGKEIQEYGILIAAPLTKEGSTPISMSNLLPSMVVIENSGKHEGENAYQILRAKSTRIVGANQFSISVSNLPANYIYRGYAIYKDANGNLQTVYSEAMR